MIGLSSVIDGDDARLHRNPVRGDVCIRKTLFSAVQHEFSHEPIQPNI